MDLDLDELVKKYVLINATEHEGKAIEKSVLGKLLADYPELRDNLLEVRSKIDFLTEEINRWNLKKQKDELERLGGYEPVIKEEKKGLPELEVERSFVMRFAPNPDGALHLGNARPAVLCHEYVKKYNGVLILRFDTLRSARTISRSLRTTMWPFAYAGCDQWTTPSFRRDEAGEVGSIRGVRSISW